MILHFYFARRFLFSFLGVALSLGIVLALIELMDALGDHPTLPLRQVLGLVALEMPWANYEIMPLVVILASVALFVRMARSSELVVVRAAGRSALRGLMAPVAVTFLLGVLAVTIGNPIVAVASKREHDLSNRYRGIETAAFALSDEGLWLRQGDASGQTVIFAERASSDLGTLYGPSFLEFAPDGTPKRRLNAEVARLGRGAWSLESVKIWSLDRDINPEARALRMEAVSLPSDLTQDRILDSFGRPRYIPFWELPRFIAQMEASGFSARRYAVWYQSELSRPLFLVALVLMAAAFTIGHVRGTNVGLKVLFAVISGFGLYYIRNFAQILGENGQIPVALSAWAPPVAALLLALGLILHLEDG
ncbi:LPS export ABC transporter permease LptG [Roseovarius autotrophicus]|uniref:LPS export ABC transporter permease LptG n=1 Tax=Roseovarius autotrophicus TaxID=2824121 RepID=UPI0019F8B3AC|nr:LPS export ABC transporter permease LptG [Roseovarius autotrophicus]MBE0454084.1 LPS export ABC transporter permease LptG [Roseovarius sp.]